MSGCSGRSARCARNARNEMADVDCRRTGILFSGPLLPPSQRHIASTGRLLTGNIQELGCCAPFLPLYLALSSQTVADRWSCSWYRYTAPSDMLRSERRHADDDSKESSTLPHYVHVLYVWRSPGSCRSSRQQVASGGWRICVFHTCPLCCFFGSGENHLCLRLSTGRNVPHHSIGCTTCSRCAQGQLLHVRVACAIASVRVLR